MMSNACAWRGRETISNSRLIAASRDLVPALLARAEAAEAKLAEWQQSQQYRYIGKDGKPVLARALEDRAEAAEAEAARLRMALAECETEIDDYIRQEWPLDHPVHERKRQRDFDANPARAALRKGGAA